MSHPRSHRIKKSATLLTLLLLGPLRTQSMYEDMILIGKHAVTYSQPAASRSVASTGHAASQCSTSGLTFEDITELTAVEAVTLLCNQTITAVEYAQALLQRAGELECLNSYAALNATQVTPAFKQPTGPQNVVAESLQSQVSNFGCFLPLQVLEEASEVDGKAATGDDVGPLCGLSFAIKDNMDVQGYATAAGTPALDGEASGRSMYFYASIHATCACMETRPAWSQCEILLPAPGLVLEASSPLVDRLRQAHGIVLGKTRMHELAEGVTSISPAFGPVLNPHRVNVHVGGEALETAVLQALGLDRFLLHQCTL